MSNGDFEKHVTEMLGRIDERLVNACTGIEGMKKTLYGDDGTTGLVREVRRLKHQQGLWNKLIGLATLALGGAVAWIKYGGGKP